MGEGLRQAARRLRYAAVAGVRSFGGFPLIASSEWRRRGLLILCYHGVSLHDEHEWASELFVTPAFLRRRFEILREDGCTVLQLGDAVQRMRHGSLPPRSVVLTFDDGFYNFHSAAVPLLEEFGYPATNYVSTYYSIHQRPVPMIALLYLLWRARLRVLPPGVLPGQDRQADLRESGIREQVAVGLLRDPQILSGGREAQYAMLCDVAARLEVDWDDIMKRRLFHLMTATEVTDVARRGFDVQLHTHRHRTPRDKVAFCQEVIENRRLLEEMTGRPAVHFCYPSGVVEPDFLPWLHELEVQTATTGFSGLAGSRHDSLLLPRFVDTMAQPEVQFSAWLCGIGALLSRRT